MHQIFTMFLSAVAACFSWFSQVFEASGLLSSFLGVMIISILFSKIIAPMMRGAGSDRAGRKYKHNDSADE